MNWTPLTLIERFRHFQTVVIFFFHSVSLRNKRSCAINAYNKSITIQNLRKNCNNAELWNIFTNLKAGTFPIGTYKGYVIHQEETYSFWNSKTITYVGGTPPNEHGTLINTIFKNVLIFRATVYRHRAPIDGKESIFLDYQHDILLSFMLDYVREVQRNVYLGISTVRPFVTHIASFFLLYM